MGVIDQLASQAGGSIIGAGMGMILGQENDDRQYNQQARLQALQIQGQKDLTDYNFGRQLEMWKQTNYPAQVEMLKQAGLNPALMYGMGGGGGTTSNVSQGSVTGAQAPQGGHEVQDLMGMGLQSAMNLKLMAAQEKVLETQADKNEAEATKTRGADTANTQADTQNKILQQVVTEYTGKEAKDVYENIMKPNRDIQAKTYMDEMQARQGVAGTVYELWVEGKLKDKSLNDIEQVALQNAKTRAETIQVYKTIDLLQQNIKGAELNNIMLELEKNLQTKTGIDKNSPAWMKILGRLFVELTQ